MKKAICLLLILSLLSVTASALSLGDVEVKNYLKPESSAFDKDPQVVTLTEGGKPDELKSAITDLDGEWSFSFGTSAKTPESGVELKYSASVPCSVYTALTGAGVINDPYVGTNQIKAAKYASRYYYFEKTFTYSGDGKAVRLCFDGVADRCEIYLNGESIAAHQGMFGGPYIDVSGKLRNGENKLWVLLKPALNYTETVVFNCSYGWHYGQLKPLGIWNDVYLEDLPQVEVDSPFITTLSSEKMTMDYQATLVNRTSAAVTGTLNVTVSPSTFTGKTYSASVSCTAQPGESSVRLRFDIPEGKLWWPNTVGEQNLYTLTTVFSSGSSSDAAQSEFGIRTLEFEPFPSGENQGSYNRTVVINGKKIFMKGAGWCTIDEMMRFTTEDYDRILSRAHEQGINFLRAWGGGMPETDEFYALCNKYGICVYQEWPCCWDSSKTQPADVLYETVVLNTKRIRNNPSLIVYGGGNEGNAPFTDTTLNNMGKLTLEYDGTRPFWRQDGAGGGGGFSHDHIHWGGQSPEHYATAYANLTGVNLHEYGLDSMMNLESVLKYATQAEVDEFPVDPKGTIAHHSATFNGGLGWNPTPYGYDIDTFIHYASDFLTVDSVQAMITGSQLAQTMADYLAAANARTQFPYTTAVAYYKMNDVFPGGSWAVVDWYGSPKIAHWFLQDAYAPLCALGRFDRYNTYDKADKALSVPIYLLDDGYELTAASESVVTVTAYNGALQTVKTEKFTYKGALEQPISLGDFTLTSQQTDSTPLFIVISLAVDGKDVSRYYVPMNFDSETGCLFSLPRTSIEVTRNGNEYTIKNTGSVPAFGVNFLCPSVSDTVTISDNYFWLDAGETKKATVSSTEGIEGVAAFNAADETDVTPPEKVTGVKVAEDEADGAKIEWNASEDDTVIGYKVYVDGQFAAYTSASKAYAVVTGLDELRKYAFTVVAADRGGNEGAMSDTAYYTTPADTKAAEIKAVRLTGSDTLVLTLTRTVTKASAENVNNYRVDGTTVTSAVLSEDGLSVTLTTETDIADGEAYVTMAGVRDNSKSGNRSYSYALINTTAAGSYDFDEGNGLTAADGNGAFSTDAVITNGTWQSGVRGACIGLDGIGSVALGSTDFSAEGTTVSMWLNAEKYDGYNILFAKNAKIAGHFEIYTQDGALKCYMPDTGDYELGVNMKKYVGQWHHFAFVFDKGVLTVYVDGEKASVTKVGTPAAVEADMAVGSLIDGSLGFVGLIDEVRLYNKVLTEAEIVSVKDGNVPEKLTQEKNVYLLEPNEAGFTLALPEGATVRSLDEGVVKVSADGKVSVVGEGETVIEIAKDGKYDLCAVYVGTTEPPQAETSEPDTTSDETAAQTGDETTTEQPSENGNAKTVIIIVAAVLAVGIIALAVVLLIKKKKTSK